MRPPVMTQEQTEIYAAAEELIGSDVIFKYPNVNGTHSAFVLYDYDGDGQDEALVFYQNTADANARMTLMDKVDGVWYSVGDAEGSGTDVDTVEFAHLNAMTQTDIVIEWRNLYDKTVTVTTVLDGRLEKRFSSTYTTKKILDIDKDGIDELVLLTGNRNLQEASALLVESVEDGSLAVTSNCPMSPETMEYVQVAPSITSSGGVSLVVDGKMGTESLISEIIAYDGGRLTNLIYSKDAWMNLTTETYRPSLVLSSDIDYDGMVEIPALTALPSQDTGHNSMEQVYLTQWMKLVDNRFEVSLSAVTNRDYGYYLIYPERWLDRVTVVVDRANEWKFCAYTQTGGGGLVMGDTLLRIKVFAKDDYYDDFDTQGYERIASNDQFEYYAILEYVPDNDLQLGAQELTELFVPISA